MKSAVTGEVRGFKRLLMIMAGLFLCLLIMPGPLSPDTVILKDGTLLVGKVRSETADALVFKNSYGAFTIPRANISALYITGSYSEDIAVRKKLGMDFDEDEIRTNYSAGEQDLTLQEKALIPEGAREISLSPVIWRIFLEGGGFMSMGELSDAIPYGAGFFAGLEAGESYAGSSRNPLKPWFRIEGGYVSFSKGDASLYGFSGGAGPLWLYPVSSDYRHNLRFALEPGISSLKIEKGENSTGTVTFTLHSLFGYEYSFQRYSVFINLRYMYVYDKDVFYNNAGVTAGVSMKL